MNRMHCKKNMISPVLIGGLVEMDRGLLYMSFISGSSRSSFIAKSLFDDPHLSYPRNRVSKPPKTSVGAKKSKSVFCKTPCI